MDRILQGLGREGYELSQPYWNLLRNYGLVRTAEEEEREQFQRTRAIEKPTEEFAIHVSSLLKAALRSCMVTRDVEICFVRAGTLQLQTIYAHNERLFMIHERFTDLDTAMYGLGLPNNFKFMDAVYHTSKKLFADAIEQLPEALFAKENSSCPTDWHRQLELRLVEQRLINFLRLNDIEVLAGHNFIRNSWAHSSLPSDMVVEVQCHDASRCSLSKENVLIAADGELLGIFEKDSDVLSSFVLANVMPAD